MSNQSQFEWGLDNDGTPHGVINHSHEAIQLSQVSRRDGAWQYQVASQKLLTGEPNPASLLLNSHRFNSATWLRRESCSPVGFFFRVDDALIVAHSSFILGPPQILQECSLSLARSCALHARTVARNPYMIVECVRLLTTQPRPRAPVRYCCAPRWCLHKLLSAPVLDLHGRCRRDWRISSCPRHGAMVTPWKTRHIGISICSITEW